MFCHICGKDIGSGGSFCAFCGEPVASPPTPVQQPAFAPQPQPPAQQPMPMPQATPAQQPASAQQPPGPQAISIFDGKDRKSITEIIGFASGAVALNGYFVSEVNRKTASYALYEHDDIALIMFCMKTFVDRHEEIKRNNPQQTDAIRESLLHVPVLSDKITLYAKEKGFYGQYTGDEWSAVFLARK